MRFLTQALRIIVCLTIVFSIGTGVIMFKTGIQPKVVTEDTESLKKGSLALIDTNQKSLKDYKNRIYAIEKGDRIYLRPITLKTKTGCVVEDIEGENILISKQNIMGTVTDSFNGLGTVLKKICRLPVAIVLIILVIFIIILPDLIPLKQKKQKSGYSVDAKMGDIMREQEEYDRERKELEEQKNKEEDKIYIIEKLGKKKLKISKQTPEENETGEDR